MWAKRARPRRDLSARDADDDGASESLVSRTEGDFDDAELEDEIDKMGNGVVVFELPNGQEKGIKFTKCPIGITYHPSLPVTVGAVAKGSQAEELRVKPGWLVTRVSGEDVEGKKIDEAQQILARMESELVAKSQAAASSSGGDRVRRDPNDESAAGSAGGSVRLIEPATRRISRVDDADLSPGELQERLDSALKLEAEATKEMNYEKSLFNDKLAELRQAVEKKQAKRKEVEQAIDEHKRHLLEMQAVLVNGGPEGPECLLFLEGSVFKAIDILVVTFNIAYLCFSFIKGLDIVWLSQGFLVFYFIEWILAMALWRSKYYIGPYSHVSWNWLDTTIVLAGVFEMWIVPFLNAEQCPWLDYVRFLRMGRLLRIVKLVNIFLHANMDWTMSSWFEGFIMGVIGFNALLLGAEDWYTDGKQVYLILNNVLQLIYTFEIACRLKIQGLKFFYGAADLGWNYLDLVIVFGGVIDIWIVTPIQYLSVERDAAEARLLHGGHQYFHAPTHAVSSQEDPPEEANVMLQTLRLMRLLRVLRIVRLIRKIKPLFTLICGIAQSMAGMVWVLLLTLTVLYVTGIVGRNASDMVFEPGDEANPFPNLSTAIFNLFMVMNADVSSMTLLMEEQPWFRWVVCGFMVFTNWAIFSILTAVVSDNMSKVAEEYTEEDAELERKHKEEALVREIGLIFALWDKDGTGVISETEFIAALKDDVGRMQLEGLCGCDREELWDVFDCFSVAGLHASGQRGIDKRAFVSNLQSAESSRSIIRVTQAVEDLEKRFMSRLEASENLLHSELFSLCSNINKRITDLGGTYGQATAPHAQRQHADIHHALNHTLSDIIAFPQLASRAQRQDTDIHQALPQAHTASPTRLATTRVDVLEDLNFVVDKILCNYRVTDAMPDQRNGSSNYWSLIGPFSSLQRPGQGS